MTPEQQARRRNRRVKPRAQELDAARPAITLIPTYL